ncbi:hypothetical protein A8B78_09235 [Jannaschia sp. EhC01]|nr:hypothetical protein A8B78_09235 [Jannaschia sp. EhC01]
MSDFDQRNRNFDYAPPTRGGSGSGALIFIAGLVVLFILAMLFMGGGSSTLPEEGAAPAGVPSDEAPVVDPTAPVLVD